MTAQDGRELFRLLRPNGYKAKKFLMPRIVRNSKTPVCLNVKISSKQLIYLVPAEGFEPPTPRLRSGCSTPELRRHGRNWRNCARLNGRTCHWQATQPPVPVRSFEQAQAPGTARRLGFRIEIGGSLGTGIVGHMQQRNDRLRAWRFWR